MWNSIKRKTLLNKSGVEWTDYNCNHYVGCAHNCAYPCYARILSKKKPSDWTRVVFVENALELAVKGIRKIPDGAMIMVSSMTDPYQPIEQQLKLTRALLPVLAGFPGKRKVRIITKSDLVKRDFQLIRQLNNVELCMTISSMFKLPHLEPYAPGNPRRIEALKEAHKLGIWTVASIEPWIPRATNPLRIIHETRAFVDEYILGSWNYKGRSEAARKRRAAFYAARLPTIEGVLSSHMKKYLVKKELRALVESY